MRIMAKAMDNAMVKEAYVFDCYNIVATRDHILASQCSHEATVDGSPVPGCRICEFNTEINLPQLPEMIYPNNSLTISYETCAGVRIHFNALDALKLVDCNSLPEVQVGPSAVWQQSRKDLGSLKRVSRPFDWTFTSTYQGTVEGFQVEPSSETIDMEKLKRREPIRFYSQIMLYEDELADHGCAQMSVRIRVMPDCFFLLCRFYLRVDGVLLRTCDTRIFGERGSSHLIREWSKREAKYNELSTTARENMLEPSTVWQFLPVLETNTTKLTVPLKSTSCTA